MLTIRCQALQPHQPPPPLTTTPTNTHKHSKLAMLWLLNPLIIIIRFLISIISTVNQMSLSGARLCQSGQLTNVKLLALFQVVEGATCSSSGGFMAHFHTLSDC